MTAVTASPGMPKAMIVMSEPLTFALFDASDAMMPVMLRVTSVRMAVLAPVVLVLCVIGAYALNNTMQSVYVLLLFGVVGYALVKLGFPLAPLILGLILGDQIELNLVRAIMTDSDPWLFITRPISGALLLASVLSIAAAIWQHLRHPSLDAADGGGEVGFHLIIPEADAFAEAIRDLCRGRSRIARAARPYMTGGIKNPCPPRRRCASGGAGAARWRARRRERTQSAAHPRSAASGTARDCRRS